MAADNHFITWACANALASARTSTERGAVVREYAERAGCSVATMYRRLKKVGAGPQRATRSDAGQTRVTTQEAQAIAALRAGSVNKRGRPNMSIKEALLHLQDTGTVRQCVSYTMVRRKLNQLGLGDRHLRAAAPAVQRVSKHPNHVWLVDVSIALQWYLRDDNGKPRFTQHAHPEAMFYEGKRQNLASLRQVLHRYVVVDHYSGAYYVRYYYSAGENHADLVDFLQRAMAPKSQPGSYPFRGVPRRLVVDQGSAFKNQYIRNLMQGLGVTVEFHGVGNAKASGAVETRHRHFQAAFEALLRRTRVSTVQQLNQLAEDTCARLNSERPLRRGATRATPMDRWFKITDQQLIQAPGLDTFYRLAVSNPFTRVVDPRMRISVDGTAWELSGGQLYPGAKVLVRETPFMEPGLAVQDEHGTAVAALKLEMDESGFATGGRLSHTWDAEDDERQGATPPAVPAQALREKVLTEEEALDLDEVFAATATAARRQVYLDHHKPTPWSAPTGVETVVATFDSFEARERVIDRLGRSLTPAEGRWWVSHLGDGVSQAELDELYARFLAEVEGSATLRQLG